MIFDQYSRYKACSDLLRQAGFTSGNSVLDIGSGSECLFGQFMPDAAMNYVDPLIPADAGPGHITGNVFASELDGRTFDCVSAVDVLEHVPPEHRQAFLQRLASLGKNTLILGFPTSDTSDALETDKAIDEQYRAIFGSNYSWLEEHYRYGLPSQAETVAQLEQLGWHCQAVGHGHAPWLRELLGFVICVNDIPSMKDFILEVSERFNQELYPYDFHPPFYRQFVIATRNPLPPILAGAAADGALEAERVFREIMDSANSRYFVSSLRLLGERDEQIGKLNKAIEEVSAWSAQQKKLLAEKDAWITSHIQRKVERVESVASRYKSLLRRKLAQSFVGDIVRYVRVMRGYRGKRISLEAVRQSVLDNQGRLIITFPIITWGFRWQRPQHIVSRLCAHGYSVLYVAMTLTPLGRRLRDSKDALVQLNVTGLAPHINKAWLNSSKQLNIYTDPVEGDDLSNISMELEALVAELHPKSIVYLVQFPGWGPVALGLRNKLGGKVVFDCMDDHGGFSTNTKQALKTEETLVENADLVLTSSNLLEDRAKILNPNTIQVKNGTEFEHFANPVRNGELDYLSSSPVIGYYGAISDWFDMDMVAHCARRRPDWNFVLIGATTGADLQPLAGLKNVHLLGEKTYKDLPGYFAYFDVCTIPFKIIPLTLATNPVKFYEYLSAGKPVVSVALPELLAYQEDCYLANNKDEFLRQLERAYAERNDAEKIERRKKLARNNSWDARVSTILESEIFTSLHQN